MSTRTERLTQLRRQEQDIRSYAASSRWYTGLSYALKFLERAEIETDDINRFREAWSAIYNLFMMMHVAGDLENKTLGKWISELKTAPTLRSLSQELPTACLESLLEAKNTLLKDGERNQWRESKQFVETWLQKRQKSQELSPEQACTYTFLIGRDLRNALGHPRLNPKAAAVKKVFKAAADQFVPLAAAAIESIIGHPIEGTTGRTTAYRSFLYPFLKNSDSFFSDYYLERLFPEEELADFAEAEAKEQLRGIAREWRSRQSTLRTADENTTRQFWCESVLFPALGTTVHQGVTLVAEDGVFDPTYVLVRADSGGTPQAEYQGKDAKRDLACLIWVLPWLTSLDAISTNPEFESLPVMEVAHRALTASDVPWAILTNGQQLRLLSRRTAHKPRCFLEIDFAAVIDRRGDTEALLSFRYLLGLFAGASFIEEDEQGRTRLDRVVAGSDRHGQEISDELKQNVFGALEEIGDGFLDYLRNHPEELEAWRQEKYSSVAAAAFLNSEQLLTDIYQESLSLMYRLLFLFYAESRNLLPMENEIYRDSYSLESIRDDIISVLDDPDPTKFYGKGDTQLWQRLQELFGLVNQGGLGTLIPAYNGGLFDPELHQFLERFQVGDYHLSRAIDLLSRTRPSPNRPRGGRTKVTYRDLDIRHLGSIYEGILEYSAHIADQELVVMKRGSSGKTYEEYVSVSELKAEERQQLQAYREATEENPENPKLPRGCKVVGVKPQGSYFLVYGGRESKRKSSGSYYTPDYIVQYIVENTLGPLVRGENREGDLQNVLLTADEILELKVLDPAMGSGHFLVAATEFLARAYGEALIKEGRDDDGIMSDEEFVRYKRIVAERCIYGVDLNPMAVELAKLSMWLFTMDRNRPLSFLNHHLKCGNSLIGAWIDDLAELPKFDRNGKPKKRQKSPGQLNMFEEQFKARVPVMVRDLFGIMRQETLTYQDVQDKKALDQAIEEMKRPFKNLADMWVGTFFWEKPKDYEASLLNISLAKEFRSGKAEEEKFFCWELGFPEIFFNEDGQKIDEGGFDAIVGNPPYVRQESLAKFKDYIEQNYKTYSGVADLYVYFFEKGINLLRSRGFFSIIVSSSFLKTTYALQLRHYLYSESAILEFVDFGGLSVFENAKDTYVCIPLLSKQSQPEEVKVCKINSLKENLQSQILTNRYYIQASRLLPESWSLDRESQTQIFEKIKNCSISLGDYVQNKIYYGIKTGLNEAFVIDGSKKNELIAKDPKSAEIIKPFVQGKDIRKWYINYQDYWLVFPRRGVNIDVYPAIKAHLAQWQQDLTPKVTGNEKKGRKPGSYKWYEIQDDVAYHSVFDEPKIVYPDIAKNPRFFLDKTGAYIANTAYCIGTDDLYLLGILNSRLSWFAISRISIPFGTRAGEFRYRLIDQYMKKLPIRAIDLSNPDEKAYHEQMITLVEQMLELHEQLSAAGKQKQATLQQQIEATDKQIDQLVYQLYGLTPDEIAIVEVAT